MAGILQQERATGFQAGLDFARDTQQQIDQWTLDEEFERGRSDAYAEAPSRLVWWLVGVLSAVAAFLIGAVL